MGAYDLGRRIVPRPFRAGLRAMLQADSSDVDPYVAGLEKRVRALERSVFELSPPEIQITPEIQRAIDQFREAFEVEGPLEQAISKRDTMYLYLVYLRGDPGLAYWEYLQTGIDAFRTYESVILERFGGFENLGNLLDFASGYGRVTRFLVRAMPPERIWMTDIKAQGVSFQQEKLGVNGFATTADPADFPVDVRFDAIFAASFFSHLPEEAFAGWLRTLYARLSDDGLLAISVNDVSRMEEPPSRPPGFLFQQYSEDGLFPYLDDGLSDGATYGTTYVTEVYMRAILGEMGCGDDAIVRRPRGLWQAQDLYLIGKGRSPLA